MSKEKQIIEEMAKDLQKSEHWHFNDHSVDFELDRKKTAENLYTAGYRKQSEGEWELIEEEDFIYCLCKCSACGKEVFFDADDKRYNFCPHCGARMSGGKNE